jgi:hypothetical protein
MHLAPPALWVVLRWRSASREFQFRDAATALGMEILRRTDGHQSETEVEGLELYARPSFPRAAEERARGIHRGFQVAVDVYQGGRFRAGETSFRVTYAKPLPFDLLVERLGGRGQIAKALGGQDVEIGDSVFDNALRVRSDNPAMTRAFFRSPNLRAAALDAFRTYPALRVTRTSLYLLYEGIPYTGDRIVAVLDALAHLAKAVDTRERRRIASRPPLSPRRRTVPSRPKRRPRR